jgi:S1-C subfamily serine protease
VVVVLSRGLLGAGVAVSPGVVLTASHLVPPDGEVDVVLRDGSRVHGTLLERADGVDAALVRIPAAPRALELGRAGTLRPGAVVATIGHPDGSRFVLATGLVAQSPADAADAGLLRLQLPVRAGASGGPVVDRSGRVVGIISVGAPGTVTFAVRIETAARALDALSQMALGAPAAGPRVVAPPGDARVLSVAGPAPDVAHASGTEVAEAERAPPIRAPVLITDPQDRSARRRAPPAVRAPQTIAAPRLVEGPPSPAPPKVRAMPVHARGAVARTVRTGGDSGELALAVMGWSALVGLGIALVAARRYR